MQFLLIGLAAGVLSGLFGIGGGIVIVPALVFIAQMTHKTATGTSLAALLLPVGALGAWQYYKVGALDMRAALLLAPGLAIGALVGAKIALQLPSRELQRAFAIFLVAVAGRMWVAAK
ncbi:MAG: sulfite exporter TauE/SafE family protein [Gemmatimonadota bacterium]